MAVTLTATVENTEPPRVQLVADGFTASAPLLTNGGFETGDTTGWDTALGTVTDGFGSLAPAEGTYYLNHEFDTMGQQVFASQTAALSGGETVVGSAAVAFEHAPGDMTLRITASPSGVSASDTLTMSEQFEWRYLDVSLATDPADTSVTVEVLVDPETTPMTGYLDHVAAQVAGNDGNVTVYREVDSERTELRGAISVPTSGGAMVWTDQEAPFGVPITYVLLEDGVEGEVTSNTVTIAAQGAPWVTNPITGAGVELTVAEWPEWVYSARQAVVAVSGRATPIVVSDVRLAASSTLVLLTQTRDDLRALRELLASGDVLLIRPVCDAVEEQYLAVGDVIEARKTPTSGTRVRTGPDGAPVTAGSDWRRRVTLAVQAVDMPFPSTRAIGDTLQDLHEYSGGDGSSLQDLHDQFGAGSTLLDIATTNMQDT